MNSDKPAIPRGTQDFSPEVMIKRSFIIGQIKKVFEKSGFLPLETPAMENLSVLTGKYGEEGDQLLFRILNSGNFLENIGDDDLRSRNVKALAPRLSEKGLRYDLTVPFARYVAMNRNEIVFPFKRYQIQPVWRADRPQKGRYREFYQCDADIIGTNSLICEAEIIAIINEAFKGLGIKDFTIKINSRKVLEGMAGILGAGDRMNVFFTILDKLEKMGKEAVSREFISSGFGNDFVARLESMLDRAEVYQLNDMNEFLASSDTGKSGLDDLGRIMEYSRHLGADDRKTRFDFTLARGLSYYTGAIFEVNVSGVSIGSVGGGGRYDNLAGSFGLPGISGVGFSFGIDRLYDAMEQLSLFPAQERFSTRILITNFGDEPEIFALKVLSRFRNRGINAEIYPENDKIKKQLGYANKKGIPFVLFIGSDELKTGKFSLKDMISGQQEELTIDEALQKLLQGN
ncbi:MAG TPA: histidine--tRNA ligase [Cyclobacteriaceae bacterium]|nr:histidine--tRNA ligase [Cyclobacteriaceae bacterium]